MDQGHHSWYLSTLLLKVWVDWSCGPPGPFLWLDESRGSFLATFTISTFSPEHSFMVKSYGVVAHVIIVTASVQNFGFGTLDSYIGIRLQTQDFRLRTWDSINERQLFRVWTNESRVLTSPLPVAHFLLQDSVPKVTRNLKCHSPNFFLGVFRSLISGKRNELILYCQVQGSLRLKELHSFFYQLTWRLLQSYFPCLALLCALRQPIPWSWKDYIFFLSI